MHLLLTPSGVLTFQLLVAVGMAAALVVYGAAPPATRRRITDARETVGALVLAALTVVAVLAAVAYFYGSRAGGSWLQRWDLYHTAISAKYFDELGYTKLYECTWVLDRAGPRRLPDVDRIRDLSTLRYVDPEDLERASDCEERFSDERRAEFLHDIAVFDDLGARWPGMLQDKGYNGTPFYTALAKGVFEVVPLSWSSLGVLARIDIVLIVGAFAAVARAFGPIPALVGAIFLFVDLPARFTHMGGSFLRFDYLAASLAGLAALRSRRHALAGGLFSYAAMVRVFPLFFLVGYSAKAAWDAVSHRRIERRHIAFGAGAGAVVVAAFVVGLIATGGLSAWGQWWSDLTEHSRNTAGFRIGLRHLFMFDGNLYGAEGFLGYAEKTENFLARREWYAAVVLLMLAASLPAVRRLDEVGSTAFLGCLLFFALLASTRYYYAILCLLPIAFVRLRTRRAAWIIAGLFAASAVGYLAMRTNDYPPWIYNTVMSYAIAVWFVGALITFGTAPLEGRTETRKPRR